MSEPSEAAVRLARVRGAVAETLARTGRPPEACRLLAVSKRIPPEQVRWVADAGQVLFGESRVQEAAEKIPLLPSALEWHFIGHLQKNKVRKILPLVTTLHGVDSLELAQAIDRIASACGVEPSGYLEVNVAGDCAKQGFSPGSVREQMEEILALPSFRLEGLMTIPPLAPDPECSRKHFAELRELRDRLEDEFGVPLPGLSMGMSGDFGVAIEEGSTIVRVGTSIFGSRPSV